MASLRRSKALSPDGQTARFLYTILKQLDLKAIDWNQVADGLEITNGHAARMRFSRFKQHMEGIPTLPRTARSKKDSIKDTKTAKGRGTKRSLEDEFKSEGVEDEDVEIREAKIQPEPEPMIKEELGQRVGTSGGGEPPAVRVKREPDQADNAIHEFGVMEKIENKAQILETRAVPIVTPTLGTGSILTSGPAVSTPPVATVSLAELHLSPAAPLFAPHSSVEPSAVEQSEPKVKSEPGEEEHQAMDVTVVIKTEPMNI